ncbi:hypothetical protein BH11GEM2_BH11GEM2_06830 [soil metagenome]
MEAGTRLVPLRFDVDVYAVVDSYINAMIDPGPMREFKKSQSSATKPR